MKRSIAIGLAALAVVGLMLTLTVRAPIGAREDPYRVHNFRVEIDGIALASFSEVSGLRSETEVIEWRDGDTGDIRLLPGSTRYSPIILQRGVTSNRALWDWRQGIIDGNVDRKSMSIVLLDAKGMEVAGWNLANAWPSKMSLGTLDANSNDVLIEERTIVCGGWVRVG